MAENRFQQWAPAPESDGPLKVTVRPEDAAPSSEPTANRFQQWAPPAAKPQSDSTQEVNALAGGFVRDIPIIGPALDSGAKAAAAGIRSVMPGGQSYALERQAVEDYAKQAAEEHPNLALAGGVAGNVAALAPIGATALGARALGMAGPSTVGRVVAGGASGAGIGAADSAARGEDPLTGAGIGGALGAAAPAMGAIVRRILSPVRTPPERQALTQVLERENVPMTAGDLTGSKPLRYAESTLGEMPFSGGRAEAIKDLQGQRYNAAVLRHAGIDAPLATPDVLQTARTNLGNTFDAVAARNVVRYDQPFARDLGQMLREYDRVLPSQQRQVLNNILQDIVSQQGQMSGEIYQATRSRLSRMAHNARNNDPEYSGALRATRDALDGAMERSLAGSPDAGVWQTVRRQWGALRTIEAAASSGGERGAQGYLTPSALKTAVASRNRGAYARGQGDLAEIARAGEGVLKPLPNSGTATRVLTQHMLSAGGGAFLGSNEGGPGAITGAAAGLLTPALLGRALLSRPVQGYLGSRAGAPAVQNAVTRALAGPARELSLDQSNNRLGLEVRRPSAVGPDTPQRLTSLPAIVNVDNAIAAPRELAGKVNPEGWKAFLDRALMSANVEDRRSMGSPNNPFMKASTHIVEGKGYQSDPIARQIRDWVSSMKAPAK